MAGYEGLDNNFSSQLRRMVEASDGRLTIVSGQRSYEDQTRLWNGALAKYGDPEIADNYVARPGFSNHEHGHAADLSGDLAWANANAARFGLHTPMSHEPWHFEPINLNSSKYAYTTQPLTSRPIPDVADPAMAGIDGAMTKLDEMVGFDLKLDFPLGLDFDFKLPTLPGLDNQTTPPTDNTYVVGTDESQGPPKKDYKTVNGDIFPAHVAQADKPLGNLSGTTYDATFLAAGQRYNISPRLLSAVAKQESGYNPNAGSPAGAQGLMQFMPGTARGIGVDPNNPTQAIHGAAQLLSSYIAQYGSIELALAAYNAGPGAVSKYGGVPPYAETQNYVRSIMGMMG